MENVLLDWCDNFYIPTNKERIAAAHKKACESLKSCGVKVHKAVAGIYLWVNMKPFLDECTKENELGELRVRVLE